MNVPGVASRIWPEIGRRCLAKWQFVPAVLAALAALPALAQTPSAPAVLRNQPYVPQGNPGDRLLPGQLPAVSRTA